jgi:hypothetical protein
VVTSGDIANALELRAQWLRLVGVSDEEVAAVCRPGVAPVPDPAGERRQVEAAERLRMAAPSREELLAWAVEGAPGPYRGQRTAPGVGERLVAGRVLYATFPARHGGPPKRRPAVLLHDARGLQDEDAIVVVAVSTAFTRFRPAAEVELPHSKGPALTGLHRPCAVVCDWLPGLRRGDVEDLEGIVPPVHLEEVLRLVL